MTSRRLRILTCSVSLALLVPLTACDSTAMIPSTTPQAAVDRVQDAIGAALAQLRLR